MDAGAMDRRVMLLRAGTVTDDYGDEIDGFASLATVWASVKPSPGTERLASAENAATAPTVNPSGNDVPDTTATKLADESK